MKQTLYNNDSQDQFRSVFPKNIVAKILEGSRLYATSLASIFIQYNYLFMFLILVINYFVNLF